MTEQQIQWMANTLISALRSSKIDGVAVQRLDDKGKKARVTFFASDRPFIRDLMLADTSSAPPEALVNDLLEKLADERSDSVQ